MKKESDYWGGEVVKAVSQGIPFSADMRRAEKIYVDRGEGLPQKQAFDPKAECIMNGELYEYIFSALSDRARILVLTCGPGSLSLELARQGHRVTGIDVSHKVIEVARQFAKENPYTEHFGSLDYQVADLNKIQLGMHKYDFVIVWNGLHHIMCIDRLFSKVRQALKPEGRFIFSDNIGMQRRSRLLGGLLYFLLPTTVGYSTKLRYVFGGAKKIKWEMSERSPFEEVSTDEIPKLARKSFRIVQEKYHTCIGYRAAIAGDSRIPESLKYPFLRFLKKMDDFAVQNGLFRAHHVLVTAEPKSFVR
ncbi:MAG: class I SAM-dependent methyltransferase [candidate division KSB1 bacterium]|nr:class I SAM-dependent methyltransferase [candidate division KSB1 bacterium]